MQPLPRAAAALKSRRSGCPQRLLSNPQAGCADSHKVTDHHHYWEDGGATYHQRFRTHEFVRGQEGDWWKGDAEKLRDLNYPDREIFPSLKSPNATKKRQDAINREQAPSTETMPQYK